MFRSKASRSRIGNTLALVGSAIEPLFRRLLIVILLSVGVRFDVWRRESVCNFGKDDRDLREVWKIKRLS